MEILSTAFANEEQIPSKYTCDGDNINPSLFFSNVPPDTQSLALIMDDPDAPNRTFVHWTIWNIKSDTAKIEENSAPSNSVQGLNSANKIGYIGPCPPSGVHRYFFKLFALDTILELEQESDAEELQKAMAGHIIGAADLIGKYQRI